MSEMKTKLINILYECNQHKTMINMSYQKLEPNFPLEVRKYLGFDFTPLRTFRV